MQSLKWNDLFWGTNGQTSECLKKSAAFFFVLIRSLNLDTLSEPPKGTSSVPLICTFYLEILYRGPSEEL